MPSQAWADRYLRFLGIEREPPGFEALARLGAAHLQQVPFENFSSLLRRVAAGEGPVPALDPEAMLTVWEAGAGGGVCFEVTEMVSNLLPLLGYQSYPILAHISFPASHHAVVASLASGPHLVDLGCGAPFPEPIPLDRVSEFSHAGLSFRFRPDLESSRAFQDRLIDGQWTQFCEYDLRPALPEDRWNAYQRHNTLGESWVTGSITLVCFRGDAVLQLRDGRYTRHTGTGRRSEDVASREHHLRIVGDVMQLPALPIAQALDAYERLTGNAIG